jgi:serine protease Do
LTGMQVITDIAKSVGESVVSINATTQVQRNSFFFGPTTQEAVGAGTGIIINEDGLILTNKHVIPDGTSSLSVTLSDGTELTDIEVIGRGRQSEDIAFIKIKDKKGKTLKPARIGVSSEMKVGDKVIAIGNAKGRFQNTVTEGIISGIGRDIEAGDESGASEELYNLIQTDAAINPGNSGGPLVNINGEIIGINTAIDGDAQGIGFAIPIDDVKSLITSVTEKGRLIRPYLGVQYVNITDDYAYQFNLSVKRGAYLAPASASANRQSPVIKDSPAEKAGLKEKDIIIKVNDTAIDENHNLSSVLGTFSAGDKVKLTILRDGNEQTIEVELGEAPQS